ncbi:hypothetical protein BRADI_1g40206v3 [Brachypodium distachyon]|uniref:Uncharacterized protein n=1 Tax=Brachypodium distachyon TaxID=15368 RepID=A0A0Q3H5T0_BRADI|nr:hypothetical protein BRADI_1g40206v3 [Brachypodium distachyon]
METEGNGLSSSRHCSSVPLATNYRERYLQIKKGWDNLKVGVGGGGNIVAEAERRSELEAWSWPTRKTSEKNSTDYQINPSSCALIQSPNPGLLPAALQIGAAAPSSPRCSRLLPSPFRSAPVSSLPSSARLLLCVRRHPSSLPPPPPALRRRPETRPGNGQRRFEQPAATAATLSSGGDALLGTDGGGILLFYLRYGLSTEDAAFKVQSRAL